ncbi:Uncharacterised protein [Mycobacterium tuberculosis]|nr:Uncharacterised protein [Mycobacterium tuberculosis]
MPGAATAGPTPATANIGGAAATGVIWAMCVGKSTTTT